MPRCIGRYRAHGISRKWGHDSQPGQSIERVLKAWLKNENAQIQEVERATQWLASLDAEQRKVSAFVTRQGEVTAQPDSNSTPVWIDNLGYFDPKRPRTSPQLLVVDLSQLDMEAPLSNQEQGARKLLRQFVEGIDWRALSADMLRDAAP